MQFIVDPTAAGTTEWRPMRHREVKSTWVATTMIEWRRAHAPMRDKEVVGYQLAGNHCSVPGRQRGCSRKDDSSEVATLT
jgi:hypothetical protein